MTYLWAAVAVVGFTLTVWAGLYNPAGMNAPPSPLPPGAKCITTGPYRWLKHPMYVGEWLTVVGLAGVAAGFWNALAMATLAELLLREWAMREDGGVEDR